MKVCHNIEMMTVIRFLDESFLTVKVKALSISRSIRKITIMRLIMEIGDIGHRHQHDVMHQREVRRGSVNIS